MAGKKDVEPKYEILNFEGTKYRTNLSKKFLARVPWEAVNPNEVRTPIPGTVLKILVREGQKVTEGKTLYILESMKMKNRFNAEKSGIVKKIHAQEGEIIPKLFLLMELEDPLPKLAARALASIKKSKTKSKSKEDEQK